MSGEIKHRARRSLQRAGSAIIESLEERQLLTLTIQVTGSGGPSGSNSLQVTNVGQVVSLQVWAEITDPQTLPTEDGVEDIVGSFLSTGVGPGPVAGNLASEVMSPFDANGSQNGTSVDLNGDGNLDVGSNDNDNADGFFFARSDGMETSGSGTISGDALEFEIGTLTYTVTSLNFGGETDINFRPRGVESEGFAAVWREDGNGLNDTTGTFTAGAPFVVTDPAVTPPPTAVNDSASTILNTPVTVHVLDNDTGDAALDPTTVVVASQPADGTASANSDGTVTYIPANGFIGSDSFTYTVDDVNGKTSNAATVDVSTGLGLSSAKGGAKSLIYTDAAGTVTTISLNIGQADLGISGSASAVTKNGKITLNGTSLITGVTLSGTTAASVLTIKSKGGDGVVSIPEIDDDAAMGKIIAPTLDFTGTSTIDGLSALQVAQLNGAILTIGSGGPTALTIISPTITGASITAAGEVVSITAASVTSTTLNAQSAKTIKVSGAVSSLTASFTAVSIAGQLTFGDVSSLILSSAGAFKTVNAASLTSTTITSGPISSLHVKGAVTNSNVQLTNTTSGPIHVVVGGALENSTVNSTGTLSAVSVGSIDGSNVTTAGDLLSLSTSSVSGSTILAGASNTVTLDNVTAANVGTMEIRTIKVTKTFSDSTVIAQTIGSASLGAVSNSGSTPTGLGAQVYKSAKLSVNGIALNLESKQLALLSALKDALTAKNVPLTQVDNSEGTPAIAFGSGVTLDAAEGVVAFVADNG